MGQAARPGGGGQRRVWLPARRSRCSGVALPIVPRCPALHYWLWRRLASKNRSKVELCA